MKNVCKGRYSKKYWVCVKACDNTTHHPLLILDWGYPPALTEENPSSPKLAVLTRWELGLLLWQAQSPERDLLLWHRTPVTTTRESSTAGLSLPLQKSMERCKSVSLQTKKQGKPSRAASSLTRRTIDASWLSVPRWENWLQGIFPQWRTVSRWFNWNQATTVFAR